MTHDPDLLEAVERAAARGWPAGETADIDGWLARTTSGGSVRANTVAALDYTGSDVAASVARVVAFYRERGAVPRFTVSAASRPPGLDGHLAAAGWRRSDDHLTMVKAVGVPSAPALEIHRSARPDAAWYAVYLQGLSANRRAAAPAIVERVPAPCVFLSARRAVEVMASGLTVIDGALASVQCMATQAAARRTGAATAVLCAIEDEAVRAGARWLYLQTDADNAAAIGLYTRFGFTTLGRYHTRDCESPAAPPTGAA